MQNCNCPLNKMKQVQPMLESIRSERVLQNWRERCKRAQNRTDWIVHLGMASVDRPDIGLIQAWVHQAQGRPVSEADRKWAQKLQIKERVQRRRSRQRWWTAKAIFLNKHLILIFKHLKRKSSTRSSTWRKPSCKQHQFNWTGTVSKHSRRWMFRSSPCLRWYQYRKRAKGVRNKEDIGQTVAVQLCQELTTLEYLVERIRFRQSLI